MKNARPPFAAFAPECYPVEELLQLRVDREREINEVTSALVDCYHNVLLYGERGTGKTFLVQILLHRLQRECPDLLPVSLSASHLHHYGPDDEVSAFSRAVVLQICAEVWRSVLGKKYSELRASLEDIPSKISFAAAEQKLLQRIYACVMTRDHEARYEAFNSVGFSAGAKGEKNETHSIQRRQSDLLPFELFELADEILTGVLRPRGKQRIVILCDEGNHLPFLTQHELIQRYIEVFRSRKIQFLFVAGYLNWEKAPEIPQCFETRINLTGFSDFGAFTVFIRKYAGDSVQVDDAAIRKLWSAFEGHPRRSLEVCHQCLGGRGAGAPLVLEPKAIARSISDCRAQMERSRQDIEEERALANKMLEPPS